VWDDAAVESIATHRAADTAPPVAGSPTAGLGGLAGAAGVAVAIGATELAAGLVPGLPSLVAAVGSAVIDLQPPGAKDFVVALFGTNDKLALELFIVAVALAVGGLLGGLATRREWIEPAGFAAFGLLAFLATLVDPQSSPTISALSAGAAVWLGLAAARFVRRGRRDGPEATATSPDWARRGFLLRGGTLLAASGVAGVAGRALLESRLSRPAAAEPSIPPAAELAHLPAGAALAVDGLTPLVVPNEEFYRIDTALLVPSVDLATWRLRIHGLVERETELTFEDLVSLPLIEQYVTIACVSNEVGGRLVGNAKWTGVRLREVLDLAGVRPEATQLVGRSVDGWTAGMPAAWVLDLEREPMIAVRMNDAPLPVAHGFPARLIVPGLFGYVSATKWLSELELTTWEAFDGYWVPLGWAKEGPILTQSRIDVPRHGARVGAGTVVVAGVAWAPDRGVRSVEVSVDGGPWAPATLSTPISDATWVQWRYDWAAMAGAHELAVRATDGTGEVQTDERTPPAPDGARGHHTIRVDVA
jgi:DMSO/TMAO reductase YedYZ molybdopterin-dependent catalytic subunit